MPDKERHDRSFGWQARADKVNAAHAKLGKGSPEERAAAVTNFHRAIAAAYPPDFDADYRKLKARDPAGVETAISFLEADPWFFRTGYIKARLARFLKTVELTQQQRQRLRNALIAIVQSRHRTEFREMCRLARALATPEFAEQLRTIASRSDEATQVRARWMLAQIEEKLRLDAAAEAKSL